MLLDEALFLLLPCCRFFSLLFVYIVVGMSYNKFAQGSSGKELIPNYSFWVEFPVLVKVNWQAHKLLWHAAMINEGGVGGGGDGVRCGVIGFGGNRKFFTFSESDMW